MNWGKLSDDQLAMAEKVGAAATKHGLNPDFVLPMVYAESGFKHVKNPDSNAFGVMQLIPATAKGLKVDPTDVDQNIDGGMRLLKELIADKNIGNDPYKVLAGYNAKRDSITKFLASGNVADLPDETLQHITRVSENYGGELPSVSSMPPSGSAGPVAVAPSVPVPDAESPDTKVKDIQNPDGTSGFPQKSAKELALLGGAAGAVTGGALTGGYATYQGLQTAKNALSNLAQAAQNAPVPVAVSGAAPGAVPGAPTQIAPAGATSGEKWAVKTGYGKGAGTVQDVSSRFQRAIGHGPVSGSVDKLWGPALAGEDPQLAQRLIDRARAAEVARNAAAAQITEEAAAAAAQITEEAAAVTRAQSLPGRMVAGLSQAAPYIKPALRVAGSALGGAGAAVQGYSAAQDYAKNGLTLRSAAKGLAALGSAAAMVPSGLTQIGGALAQIPAAGFDIYDYAANRLATDLVNDYQTVPTMLPRQRRTTPVYPGAQ